MISSDYQYLDFVFDLYVDVSRETLFRKKLYNVSRETFLYNILIIDVKQEKRTTYI